MPAGLLIGAGHRRVLGVAALGAVLLRRPSAGACAGCHDGRRDGGGWRAGQRQLPGRARGVDTLPQVGEVRLDRSVRTSRCHEATPWITLEDLRLPDRSISGRLLVGSGARSPLPPATRSRSSRDPCPGSAPPRRGPATSGSGGRGSARCASLGSESSVIGRPPSARHSARSDDGCSMAWSGPCPSRKRRSGPGSCSGCGRHRPRRARCVRGGRAVARGGHQRLERRDRGRSHHVDDAPAPRTARAHRPRRGRRGGGRGLRRPGRCLAGRGPGRADGRCVGGGASSEGRRPTPPRP